MKNANQENDYVLAKFFSIANQLDLRLWTLREYYTALEELLKESDRIKKQQNGRNKGRI
jgi:hypothetical protein